MKKILLVLAVATVFVACNNDKATETETTTTDTAAPVAPVTTDTLPGVDTTVKADTSVAK